MPVRGNSKRARVSADPQFRALNAATCLIDPSTGPSMSFASTDQPHGERNDTGENHEFRKANTKHGHTIWMVVLCTAITALIAA